MTTKMTASALPRHATPQMGGLAGQAVALDHPLAARQGGAERRAMRRVQSPLKRAMDAAIALAALIVLAPLLLLIALVIKLDSPGPALYRQVRSGQNDDAFLILKFRTLRIEACTPPTGGFRQVTCNDLRVTRIGRFLRWTSLDELPQLINVLRGEMSIVGPRPHAVTQTEHYAARIPRYLDRHAVKPGITGWAQVNGLRGETETLEKMEQRVGYDLYYVDHWSLMFDLRIMARTLRLGFLDRSH